MFWLLKVNLLESCRLLCFYSFYKRYGFKSLIRNKFSKSFLLLEQKQLVFSCPKEIAHLQMAKYPPSSWVIIKWWNAFLNVQSWLWLLRFQYRETILKQKMIEDLCEAFPFCAQKWHDSKEIKYRLFQLLLLVLWSDITSCHPLHNISHLFPQGCKTNRSPWKTPLQSQEK